MDHARSILRICKTLVGKSLTNQRSIRQIRQCFLPPTLYVATASPFSRTVINFTPYNPLVYFEFVSVLASTQAELRGVNWCAVDKTRTSWMLEGWYLLWTIMFFTLDLIKIDISSRYILCSSMCLCQNTKRLIHVTQLSSRCLADNRRDMNKMISTSVEIHLNLHQHQGTSIHGFNHLWNLLDLVRRLTQLKLIITYSRTSFTRLLFIRLLFIHTLY